MQIIRLIALCTCLAAVTLAQQPAAPLEKLAAEGVEALKDGRTDEAERIFQQLLRQGGRTPFALHNLGIVYQQRGDHARAVAQFREAVRLQPTYGPAHLLMGVSLAALGKTTEAVSALERAVRLMPQEPQARLQLARAYERADNWPGAVGQYEALRQLVPQEPEYAYQLGRAYSRLAGWSYQRIAQLDPNSARLHQSLGQQYLMQGRTELAIRSYQQAAQADPKLPEIHLALALIYLEQKRLAEAAKEIELELKLVPHSKTALAARQQIEAAKAASPR
ncbi:MAG TPA: tetratricopeptide repeat protein [Blastocatellia bacterium]|nr:tetratricopeptide repeat protein [Blastocatellia bacterium]